MLLAIRMLIVILMLVTVGYAQSTRPQTGSARADVLQYLDFLRTEQDELEFQIRHEEISQPNYQTATIRINILRNLIISFARVNSQDPLPDYQVVPTDQVNNLIPNGLQQLRRARVGQIIDGKWRYLKRVMRGQGFYVFERVESANLPNSK